MNRAVVDFEGVDAYGLAVMTTWCSRKGSVSAWKPSLLRSRRPSRATMRSIHMENRLLPSNRRPATLSIRRQRSLCVHTAGTTKPHALGRVDFTELLAVRRAAFGTTRLMRIGL